ncbi:MAG TPA: signal peptidase II [Vicinamibacterales bacterium]|nr:signal peptidase II [Vicinamibacterales bacterium]
MVDEPRDVPMTQTGGRFMGGGPPAGIAVDALPPADRPATPPRAGILWWLAIGIIVADQVTKAMVRSSVALFDSRPLVPGLVDLAHVRNEGVAFGLFNASSLPYKWVLTTALALAALLGITYYARHLRGGEKTARIGLSMILGGALGNLIDRLWAGYVLDFVDVYWRNWHFWAFNVADACISIGAVLVFVDLLLVKPHASHPVSDR